MKRIALAALMAIGIAAIAPAVPGEAAPDPKITICHFPGHAVNHPLPTEFGIFGDYAISHGNVVDPSGDLEDFCEDNGNIITISCNGLNGHPVDPAPECE